MTSGGADGGGGVLEREAGTRNQSSMAGLVEAVYRREGLSPPRWDRLHERELPQPYRRLLVHSSDMTPTLEEYYGQSLAITVLHRERREDVYWREVVLRLAGGCRRVGYGVIRIRLDRLPMTVQQRVLEAQRPLGNILLTESIPHLSWPQSFFRVESDAHLARVLGLSAPASLYGRRNILVDGSRRLLADVLEVLAPAGAASSPGSTPETDSERPGINSEFP